jgi:hypothetical protein
MRGAIPPLPQYAFVGWCSVKVQGQPYTIIFLIPYIFDIIIILLLLLGRMSTVFVSTYIIKEQNSDKTCISRSSNIHSNKIQQSDQLQQNSEPLLSYEPLFFFFFFTTRAVCKVSGPASLLQAGNLWRCGDGLSFEVPHLASNALLTTLYPLLENVLQTVDHFEISCLGAPFSWLEKPRDLNWILCSVWKKWIGRTPLEHPPYSPERRQEISKWPTVCSTFSRSGWSVVRSVSLAKKVLRKRDSHRTSIKFRLEVIRRVH